MNINSAMQCSASALALILGLLGLAGCNPGVRQGVSEETRKVGAGNNAFALDLYRQLKGPEGNLFYSLCSICRLSTQVKSLTNP